MTAQPQINIIWRKHYTVAGRALRDASCLDGATPADACGSWARYDRYRALVALAAAGLAEKRRSGPRRGVRWHATPAGVAALRAAQNTMTE